MNTTHETSNHERGSRVDGGAGDATLGTQVLHDEVLLMLHKLLHFWWATQILCAPQLKAWQEQGGFEQCVCRAVQPGLFDLFFFETVYKLWIVC